MSPGSEVGVPGGPTNKGGTVRRFRWFIALAVVTSVALAMGGAVAPAQTGGGTKPTASDVGVDATTINITVPAAIDVPGSPGLFQGSIRGGKARAPYEEDKGGVARGRKRQLKGLETKPGPHRATNSLIHG